MGVIIQSEDFAIDDFATPDDGISGGHAMFLGTVRSISQERALRALTIEHYPGMSESALQDIEKKANMRWSLDDSLILHRYGRLLPGDKIVLVMTRSKHRNDAFDACRFIMDWLKTEAPFWKREEFADGTQNWVTPRIQDEKDRKRWNK